MKATQVWHMPATFLFLSVFQYSKTEAQDIKWPKYSQQCQDDAGPPFQDDVDGKKYHDGTPAYAVLPEDGSCPIPLKQACQDRPSIKTAYLEGPVDCGNQGWFCRMTRDENFEEYDLKGDYNFAHCNSTKAFKPDGSDTNGHCHGSSTDDTYYWWIRDHWHRRYNGHVHCCCGWYTGDDYDYPDAVTSGRITNGCDYRRQVPESEDESKCRDANEDHGLGFVKGCKKKFKDQIGEPIPEDNAQCWDIALFGDTKDGSSDSDGSDSDDEECIEKKSDEFYIKLKKQGTVKTCKWLKKKNKSFIKKKCKAKKGGDDLGPAKEVCPITCKQCEPEEDSDETSE